MCSIRRAVCGLNWVMLGLVLGRFVDGYCWSGASTVFSILDPS
jgi:hypothetical protein